MNLRFTLLALTAALAITLPASYSAASRIELPDIGNPADRYLSPANEKKIGENFLRNVYRHNAVLEDPEISSYIQHLGNELSNTLADGAHKFTLFVVKDNGINAFAVPGGYIGVNAGLILAAKTESELASVVAHEIAHISQRHLARKMADISSSQIPTLGAMLAGILLAASGSGDAGSALMLGGVAAQRQQLLNFSRDMEIEADRIGLDILYRSGYDPRGMPAFFRNLQRQRHSTLPKEYQFLVTHPLDSVRISEAQSRIDRLPAREHKSSDYFHYAKSRLHAIIHNNPTAMVHNFEKKRAKGSSAGPLADYAFSQALERKNMFHQADKLLTKLAAKDRENIFYQLALARVKIKNNDHKGAAKILQHMLNLYPDHFAVNYYYAKNLMQMGQATQGKETLKKYLGQHPAPTMEVFKLMAELHQHCNEPVNSKKTLAEYYFNTGNTSAAVFQLQDALREPDIDIISRSQIQDRLREILQMTQSARASRS